MALVTENMPSKHEALGSKSSTDQKLGFHNIKISPTV
jgi:hypothetical protein